jgi:hypothetical protein
LIPLDSFILFTNKSINSIILVDNNGEIICSIPTDTVKLIIIIPNTLENMKIVSTIKRFYDIYKVYPNNAIELIKPQISQLLISTESIYPYYYVNNRMLEETSKKVGLEMRKSFVNILYLHINIYHLLNILYQLKVPPPSHEYPITPLKSPSSILGIYPIQNPLMKEDFNLKLIEYYHQWSLNTDSLKYESEHLLRKKIIIAIIKRLKEIGHCYEY